MPGRVVQEKRNKGGVAVILFRAIPECGYGSVGGFETRLEAQEFLNSLEPGKAHSETAKDGKKKGGKGDSEAPGSVGEAHSETAKGGKKKGGKGDSEAHSETAKGGKRRKVGLAVPAAALVQGVAAVPAEPPAQVVAAVPAEPPAQVVAAVPAEPPAQVVAAVPAEPPAQVVAAVPAEPPEQAVAAVPAAPPAQAVVAVPAAPPAQAVVAGAAAPPAQVHEKPNWGGHTTEFEFCRVCDGTTQDNRGTVCTWCQNVMKNCKKRQIEHLMDPKTGTQTAEQKAYCDLVRERSLVKRARAESKDSVLAEETRRARIFVEEFLRRMQA